MNPVLLFYVLEKINVRNMFVAILMFIAVFYNKAPCRYYQKEKKAQLTVPAFIL
jgi:hypothetical protein